MVSKTRPRTTAAIRALLRADRSDCDDSRCRGWDVFESGRGLEIQRCDACCPDVLADDDVARLPEARRALRAALAFAATLICPRDGSPLRMCRARDPACMHCDVCSWCGDRSRPARGATTSSWRAVEPDPVERAIADAARHGCESDHPDHEVGDLQQLVRLLALQLGPKQVETAMLDWSPWHSD